MTADNDLPSLEPMIRKLAYWLELDADDRSAIRALPFTVKLIERHHYLVREHDVATHCGVLLSGYAVRTKALASGSRQILSIHIKGDLVDLQNSILTRADHSIQMLTPATVAIIPRAAVVKLATKRPMVARAMWIDTLVDGSIFREWIANVGRRDARTRIAHLLCEFSLRLKVAGISEDSSYQLPMTQEQLGDATGLTPVHVNRTMKGLEADGLIERPDLRSIRIGDWRKLADAGDFDSNYLHLRGDDPALAGMTA